MAVVLGISILILTFAFAVVAELTHGVTVNRSWFVEIMVTGVPVAFLVAATHWLPW